MSNIQPLYKKVYESLRQLIVDETFKEGDLLPSENELCAIHGVTRPTIRKALDSLLNEGYIKKHQGKGSIVKGVPKGIGILAFAGTTSAIGKEKLKTIVISKPKIIKCDRAFNFALNKKEQSLGCIKLERLRIVNNSPVFFDISVIPNLNLPRFTARNFENKSLFDILRKHYQIQVKGGEQEISAIRPNEVLQKYFNVTRDHPILQINRKFETNRPDYCFYSQVLCNTEESAIYGTF
jgi:DNA-binding GntR family transcriptional regulator